MGNRFLYLDWEWDILEWSTGMLFFYIDKFIETGIMFDFQYSIFIARFSVVFDFQFLMVAIKY